MPAEKLALMTRDAIVAQERRSAMTAAGRSQARMRKTGMVIRKARLMAAADAALVQAVGRVEVLHTAGREPADAPAAVAGCVTVARSEAMTGCGIIVPPIVHTMPRHHSGRRQSYRRLHRSAHRRGRAASPTVAASTSRRGPKLPEHKSNFNKATPVAAVPNIRRQERMIPLRDIVAWPTASIISSFSVESLMVSG